MRKANNTVAMIVKYPYADIKCPALTDMQNKIVYFFQV